MDTPTFSGLPSQEEQHHSGGPSSAWLHSRFLSLINSPLFQQSYTSLPTSSERIHFLLSHEIVRQVIEEFIRHSKTRGKFQQDDGKKSGTRAAQFGQYGNGAFQARRYEDALESYSSAIRYAPQDGALLPIAYGSRSGAFFQLKQYEAALKDIEAAETHPKYKPFFMLTIRKCQCLVRLGRGAQVKKILDTIKRDDLNKSDAALLDKFCQRERDNLKNGKEGDEVESKKKDIESELLKNVSWVIKILSEKGRFKPQSCNSSLSSKVEIHYDEENGRHLVTTQNVHFGDILAVTKSYASVLTEKQELHYCHHCLTSLDPIPNIFPRTVPCTDCTRVLYCSEHCRTESWQEYHRFECPLLANSFEQSFTEYNSQFRLALRAFFVAGGLESIRAVTQKFDSINDPSKSTDFTWEPEDYYENFYRMELQQFDSVEMQIKSVIRNAFLFKWSKLGGEMDDDDYSFSSDDIFTIETLLRHHLQIYNSDNLFVRSDPSALDDPTAEHESFFTLDPLVSLVQRSCDPNISIHVVDCARPAPHVSNVCVFFALKPIPAGTVLTTVSSGYGDSVKYRIYLHEFVQIVHEFWNRKEPKHECPCEYCDAKRYESPFGSITTTTSTDVLNDHELVCCGATCGGFIRRIDDDDGNQVRCYECNREIGLIELDALKKISCYLSKFHSQANVLISRIKALAENENKKPNPKVFYTLLNQLETLINDRIAPLARIHSRPLLIDLYKHLNAFYRYCYYEMDDARQSNNRLDHLQQAWRYADASHATLETHFGGGNSLALLVLLQENVQYFTKAMEEIGMDLNEQVGGPSVEGNRNVRIRLIGGFEAVQKRLDRMNECYKI